MFSKDLYHRHVKTRVCLGKVKPPFARVLLYSIQWLIVWYCTPFSTVFQLYRGGTCTYPCILGVLLTSTSHNVLSHITIVETVDSDDRDMNPVAVNIINPRKEYWPSRWSNHRLPVLKSSTLLNELWGLALLNLNKQCFDNDFFFNLTLWNLNLNGPQVWKLSLIFHYHYVDFKATREDSSIIVWLELYLILYYRLSTIPWSDD